MRYPLLGLLMATSFVAHAEVQTQEIPYTAADGTQMVGYYAYDDTIEGARPGVVVVHEWWGLNDYAKQRARNLAELGYSALAIDMYGEGKNTDHPKDAMSFMQAATADADAAKARFNAATCSSNSNRPTPPNSPPSATALAARWCWTWPARVYRWRAWSASTAPSPLRPAPYPAASRHVYWSSTAAPTA